jgi:hypothetical protein
MVPNFDSIFEVHFTVTFFPQWIPPCFIAFYEIIFLCSHLQSGFFFQKNSFFLTEPDRRYICAKGYAGTGKTTVISTIVNNLLSIKYVLLAPKVAAKVIANYSENLLYDS